MLPRFSSSKVTVRALLFGFILAALSAIPASAQKQSRKARTWNWSVTAICRVAAPTSPSSTNKATAGSHTSATTAAHRLTR